VCFEEIQPHERRIHEQCTKCGSAAFEIYQKARRKVSVLWSASLRRTCRTCYTTRPSLLNGKARQASNFPRVRGSKDYSLCCRSFAPQTIDTFGPSVWSRRLSA